MQLMEENISSGERFLNPTLNSFDELDESFHILMDSVYFEVRVVKEEKYIWFEFDYGKPDPIDEKLTNINTGDKKDNPRTNEEAELLHQLFALYNFSNNVLYLSSIKKEKMFEKMLQEKLQKPFVVKKFFKPKDEFMAVLKEVNEISFTEAKNLFNQDSKKRQALIDLTGTNAPESFTLDTKYKNGAMIGNFIKKLIESKSNLELNELVIRGVDNDNFGFVFNVDSFVQKISISCEKEDSGKVNPETVRQELIKRLYDER